MNDYSGYLSARYKEETTEQLLHLCASTELTETAQALINRELRSRGITDPEKVVAPLRADLAAREKVAKAERQKAGKRSDQIFRFVFIFCCAGILAACAVALIQGDTDKAIVMAVIGGLAMIVTWLKRLAWKLAVYLFRS